MCACTPSHRAVRAYGVTPPRRLALLLSLLLSPLAPALAQTAPGTAATYPDASTSPLSIAAMRARDYPGSALTVRQALSAGSNYRRWIVSYQSDGLRINALLTVPNGTPPKGGWPAVLFNHGYIPPNVYRTTQRYVAYQDAFARAGFVTLKSDYRGHGSSEGTAQGGYYDPGYTVDVLNAAASLRRDARVDPARLGIWGHSMGGHLTLRAMVVKPEWFRAGRDLGGRGGPLRPDDDRLEARPRRGSHSQPADAPPLRGDGEVRHPRPEPGPSGRPSAPTAS